jgi:hypothetical protein
MVVPVAAPAFTGLPADLTPEKINDLFNRGLITSEERDADLAALKRASLKRSAIAPDGNGVFRELLDEVKDQTEGGMSWDEAVDYVLSNDLVGDDIYSRILGYPINDDISYGELLDVDSAIRDYFDRHKTARKRGTRKTAAMKGDQIPSPYGVPAECLEDIPMEACFIYVDNIEARLAVSTLFAVNNEEAEISENDEPREAIDYLMAKGIGWPYITDEDTLIRMFGYDEGYEPNEPLSNDDLDAFMLDMSQRGIYDDGNGNWAGISWELGSVD